MPKRSKRYTASHQKIAKKEYGIDEALACVKEMARAKFDESVEAHLHLSIDPKKSEQAIRSIMQLPHGTGKSEKIAVFTESKAEEANKAGADIVGGKDLIDDILQKKNINFTSAIATPDFMRELARIAKILGPKGLMPSPKTGTVTEAIAETINKLRLGQITIRNDALGNIHQAIGKASFEAGKLKENFSALIAEIKRLRPKGIKGAYIQGVSLCSTMGPSVRVALA